MKYFVYCLISESKGSFKYFGFTADLNKRIRKHNSGSVPSTKPYRPLTLKCFLEFDTKKDALAFEKKLNKSFNLRSQFLNNRIAGWSSGSSSGS